MPSEPNFLNEHNYYISKQQIYDMKKQTLYINTEYADDVGEGTFSENRELNKYVANYNKLEIPAKINKRHLICNAEKIEHSTIERNGSDEWKNIKYLGSKLDTEKDIKRRKQLATNDDQANRCLVGKQYHISSETRTI